MNPKYINQKTQEKVAKINIDFFVSYKMLFISTINMLELGIEIQLTYNSRVKIEKNVLDLIRDFGLKFFDDFDEANVNKETLQQATIIADVLFANFK